MGQGPGALHVRAHAGIALKIHVHITLRFAALEVELAGQAESRHAVNQTEVNRLGLAPLIAGDGVQPHAEHFAGGGAVHVQIVAKRGQQARVLGQVGHDPQLYLRVVRGHHAVTLGSDKGPAYAPAVFAADGDIL